MDPVCVFCGADVQVVRDTEPNKGPDFNEVNCPSCPLHYRLIGVTEVTVKRSDNQSALWKIAGWVYDQGRIAKPVRITDAQLDHLRVERAPRLIEKTHRLLLALTDQGVTSED